VAVAGHKLGFELRPEECRVLALAVGGKSTLLTSSPRARDLGLFATAASLSARPVLVASPFAAELYAAARASSSLEVLGFGAFVKPGSRGSAKSRLLRGGSLLVVVEPAQLLDPELRGVIAKSPLALLGVAAAHASSPEAHELSPSYLRLKESCKAFGASVLATSTQTAEGVVAAVAASIGASPSGVVVASAPALVERAQWLRGVARKTALFAAVDALLAPGIVLTLTPQEADGVFAELSQRGVACVRTHAGMAPEERAAALTRFGTPSERLVLVAVSPHGCPSGLAGSAEVGLGLSSAPPRPDLHFLIHFQAPLSLEQRFEDLAWLPAGAAALMIADSGDAVLVQAMLAQQRLKPSALEAVAEALALASVDRPATPEALALRAGVSRRSLERVLSALSDAGLITREGNCVRSLVPADTLSTEGRLLAVHFASLRASDSARAEAMAQHLTEHQQNVMPWAVAAVAAKAARA